MSESNYGRGLCPFVGPSTDVRSPTSDPTASTWAEPPKVLQQAVETDTYKIYKFIGNRWKMIAGSDSNGNSAGNTVTEIFTLGNSLNKGIENLASGSKASRAWASGNRPRMIIVEAKPSNAAETAVAVSNARVNLTFDASTAAIGEALAVPSNNATIKTYAEISLNTPTELFFPKTATYDGLSLISVYSNGVAIDLLITAVK